MRRTYGQSDGSSDSDSMFPEAVGAGAVMDSASREICPRPIIIKSFASSTHVPGFREQEVDLAAEPPCRKKKTCSVLMAPFHCPSTRRKIPEPPYRV